jgi:hypothetical protein
MDSPAIHDTTPRKFGWETALIGIIGAAIATLGTVSHLIPVSLPSDTSQSGPPKFGSPRSLPDGAMETPAPSSKKNASPNKPRAIPSPRALSSDSRVVVIGPNSIRGRFTLSGITRKLDTSGSDELTLRLHIASLALPDLVTPFQSAMLEVRMEGEGAIHPKREFAPRFGRRHLGPGCRLQPPLECETNTRFATHPLLPGVKGNPPGSPAAYRSAIAPGRKECEFRSTSRVPEI